MLLVPANGKRCCSGTFTPTTYRAMVCDSSRVTNMPQITARLSTDIRARFDRYATQVGLDASELARLLIVREMRVQRVARPLKRQPHNARGSAKNATER